jgi:hypothetical protein
MFRQPKYIYINDELREATLGYSPLYSENFKGLCQEYHRVGRCWNNEQLAYFFSEGLLQYYVGHFMGFNFNVDYMRFKTCDDLPHRHVSNSQLLEKLYEVFSPSQDSTDEEHNNYSSNENNYIILLHTLQKLIKNIKK